MDFPFCFVSYHSSLGAYFLFAFLERVVGPPLSLSSRHRGRAYGGCVPGSQYCVPLLWSMARSWPLAGAALAAGS